MRDGTLLDPMVFDVRRAFRGWTHAEADRRKSVLFVKCASLVVSLVRVKLESVG